MGYAKRVEKERQSISVGAERKSVVMERKESIVVEIIQMHILLSLLEDVNSLRETPSVACGQRWGIWM
jgi:hypothetical protein